MRTCSLLVTLLITAMASHPSYAYDQVVSDVPVGSIRVFGNNPGIDPNYVTTDGNKAITNTYLNALPFKLKS